MCAPVITGRLGTVACLCRHVRMEPACVRVVLDADKTKLNCLLLPTPGLLTHTIVFLPTPVLLTLVHNLFASC